MIRKKKYLGWKIKGYYKMGDPEHIKQLEEKIQFLEIQIKHLQNDLRLTKEEYEISTKNFFGIYSNIEKEVEAQTKGVKKLQAVLKEKAQELQTILNSSPGIIFYKDANHKYLRVNKIFSETIGVPIRKIIGKTYDKLFPDDTNHIFSDDAEVIQTGNPILNKSIMIETAIGKRQFLINKIPYKDIDGRIAGIIGFGTDITDLVEAEESLRQSEEIHRIVTDSVWDSIVIVQDAKVKWANKIALAKMGYLEDEIIGIEFKKLIHPDDLPGTSQRYQDRMSGIPAENPSYLTPIFTVRIIVKLTPKSSGPDYLHGFTGKPWNLKRFL